MTDVQPLVTVIIASYNHGPYIEQSIQSVLDQTYPNIELLVIDIRPVVIRGDDHRYQGLRICHGCSLRAWLKPESIKSRYC